MKLSLIGSNGAIGQPLGLLLAQSKRLSELSLYDIVDQTGVAMDLHHIDRDCSIKSYDKLEECIKDSQIVVVTAGVPRKPGMTRDDLFNINGSIIANISKIIAKQSSLSSSHHQNNHPFLAIITNPINANIPIATKIFEKTLSLSSSSSKIKQSKSEYFSNYSNRIFGVTTLDIMRSNRFLADLLGKKARDIFCPVIGGHSGETIIPLFSKALHRKGESLMLNNDSNGSDDNDNAKFSQSDLKQVESRIQNAGTDVVNAKKNGSASLSMAYAGYRFISNLITALEGTPVKEYCHIYSKPFTPHYGNYFTLPVLIDNTGIKEVIELEDLNDYEKQRVKEAMSLLVESEKKAEEYVKSYEI